MAGKEADLFCGTTILRSNTAELQTSFISMWSTYKPIGNNYFWVGVVLLMLAVVYGFWWIAASRNTDEQTAIETSAILYEATSSKLR